MQILFDKVIYFSKMDAQENYEFEYQYEVDENGETKEIIHTDSEKEEDDENAFQEAVGTFMNDDEPSYQEPVTKKCRVEEPTYLTDREIVHKWMGCKHCKCRFGNEEDITIHRRIDEIFNKMQQTVN